jgi:hypothetical protein
MNAAASFVALSCSITPEMPTGWAAPTEVPGAIAATWHAVRMNVPADAARAPGGETKQITGTSVARIDWMMSRIEESRPPGVSIVSRIASMPSAAAPSISEVR